MPASFHSRRGSAQPIQHSPSLPFHRSSKLYKSSNNNNNSKAKASLFHQHHQHQQQRRRRRLWLFVLILVVLSILGGRHVFFSSHNSASSSLSMSDGLDFPELTIATQYQPTPVTAPRIPKIVHFVYGLKAPDPTLDLIHYLAIKSAHDRLQPDTIMFHYHYLPTGDLFAKAQPWLTLHKVDLVPMVFDRPVTHFAHQADIIRLAMLQQYGGIYLDLDVIVMAPMDHLLDHEFVMGQEGVDGSVGLCNAVILAKPNARFLQRWQATYKTFDQADWNYHSVVLPGKLASTHRFGPDELTILNHTAFFWPLWDSPGLRTLFLEASYDFSTNYASHIWESAANPHLMAGLSENVIRHIDNSLYCQLRLLLDDQQGVRRCHRWDHSPLPDQLVGYWPLTKPLDQVLLEINPTPATDVSGNDMHGIIRNGYFGDNHKNGDGVYVSGQDSYVFLSMPNKMTAIQDMTVQWQMKTKDDKQGGVAMMIQMDTCKLMIKTTTETHGLGVEWWQLATNGWAWELVQRVDGAASFGWVGDDRYHTFTLVLGGQEASSASSLLVPNLVLYMDGMVVASLGHWTPVIAAAAGQDQDQDRDQDENQSTVVRGIWFGSAEPAKYQDAWDTRPSLAAWYKDLRVWERQVTIDVIRTSGNSGGVGGGGGGGVDGDGGLEKNKNHVAATINNDQQPKDWHVADNDIPVTLDDDNKGNGVAWEDDADDDKLD